MDKKFTFQELQAIVATLRSENGCPWDRSQTHESLKLYTLEEAYEVNQAVSDLTKTNDPSNLEEELGDLLFQVLLQAQVAEDNGEFTIEDVIDQIARKMIHRHPHVFAGRKYDSIEAQQADWEVLKAQEEGHESASVKDELSAVPLAFPALIRGEKVAKKASRHAVLSSEKEQIAQDLLHAVFTLIGLLGSPSGKEKISEDSSLLGKNVGEALFALCRLCARCNISGEMALTHTIEELIDTL